MKFLSVVLLAIAAATSATAQCPSCPAITPLFRTLKLSVADHFYTATPGEVLSAGTIGYNPEGVAAGIFPTQVPSSVPLFRLLKSSAGVTDHAYTTSPDEVIALEAQGYVLESQTPGYVYTTQICNSVPLYGLFSVSNNDHFLTTSASERASSIAGGYTDRGIAAYVPLPGVTFGSNTC
ncbi:hypothetical protein MVEN_00950600 [Mycena venus]|uniref:DUF5648 domain-containing protein n=1 Tax=Mycena venus TaxID=2733690 RepID=A0A8H6Y8C2_9AGAR|nr:hypothetical protein MVEN_00950600 [Mycena venus]